MRLRHGFWVGLAVVLWLAFEMTAHAGPLRAGAAKVSITPTSDELPYTAPRQRSFVGVHDEVYARALVLDDSKQRVALVILDATRVPRAAEIVKAVAQELGEPESNVLVAATHTHNVLLVSYNDGEPNAVEKKEIERIKQASVEAIRQAKAQLQPARIAFARGESWVSGNGSSYMGGTNVPKGREQDLYFPNGPSDKSVDVVKLESLKGEPLALMVNYPTHGELMLHSITKDNGYEVSGDLPGAVSHLLEELPTAAPVVLFTAAAEADQLPYYKSVQIGGRLPETDAGAAGWALLDVQARRLANSVLDALAGMKPGVAEVQLKAAAGTVTCPGKSGELIGPMAGPPPDAPSGPQSGPPPDPPSGSPPGEKVKASSAPPAPVRIPISLIRINDIALAGVGGDVSNEIGQQLKKASSLANTTLISMMAGQIGYIMTDDLYVNHDYGMNHGVGKTPLAPGCAEPAIIKGLIGLMGTGTSK